MRLINVETLRLETFVKEDKIPRYAILSHTWGADDEEISFEDIQRRNMKKPGNGIKKLRGCCKQAMKDGLAYAWIDTCCINKDSSKELDEAINSMFRWYRNAAVCYAYLADVSHGDDYWNPASAFFSSAWFTRGWTLQELLAPLKLHFYNQEWSSIGTREDMVDEVETITYIPRRFLLGWEDFHEAASVAQRMSWAASRQTTRKEDAAYCLLGIFNTTMTMIYGEGGDRAFRRLQEEIMKRTGDHSILAWGLSGEESNTTVTSESVVSAGVLATAPSDFANSGHIVTRRQDASPVNAFEISVGRLGIRLPLHTTSAGETFVLLSCGPAQTREEVVGIPVHKISSDAASTEYLRPQGRYSVLLPKPALQTSTANRLHIQIERQRKGRERKGPRQFWLHIDGHQKLNLKLEEEYPRLRWTKGRAWVAEASESDTTTKQLITRFRAKDMSSKDIIVVLEVEINGQQHGIRSYVMASSRNLSLTKLSEKLNNLHPELLGWHTTGNGKLNVKVTVKEELVASEPMFFLKLSRTSETPKRMVDIALELQQDELKNDLMLIEDETKRLGQARSDMAAEKEAKLADLDRAMKYLEVIEEDLRRLSKERVRVSDETRSIKRELSKIDLDELKHGDEQMWWLDQRSKTMQRLDALDNKRGYGDWRITNLEELPEADEIGVSLDNQGSTEANHVQLGQVESADDVDSLGHSSELAKNEDKATEIRVQDYTRQNPKDDGYTTLTWAVAKRNAEVRLALERGADVSEADGRGITPLGEAVAQGNETISEFLLQRGADPNIGGDLVTETPLVTAASKGNWRVVTLLLDWGADINKGDFDNCTPVFKAASLGHEATVRLLIAKGSDIGVANTDGETPLMAAAFGGHEAVVLLLLVSGANAKAMDLRQRSALSIAMSEGHAKVVEVLEVFKKDRDIARSNKKTVPVEFRRRKVG